MKFTDFSDSPYAFSETSAECIFTVYSRVSNGWAFATTHHLAALTRIAAHEPPVGTEDAVVLAADALNNFKSKFGEWFWGSFTKHLRVLN